jgi:hypothetical protein
MSYQRRKRELRREIFCQRKRRKESKKREERGSEQDRIIRATALKNTHFILVSALAHTPVRGVSFIDDESELAFDPNDDESELLRLFFSPTFVVVAPEPCS